MIETGSQELYYLLGAIEQYIEDEKKKEKAIKDEKTVRKHGRLRKGAR